MEFVLIENCFIMLFLCFFVSFTAHFYVNVAIYDVCCKIYAKATNVDVDKSRQFVLPSDKKWGMFGLNFVSSALERFENEYKFDILNIQGRCTDLKGKSKGKNKKKTKKNKSNNTDKSKTKKKKDKKLKSSSKKKSTTTTKIKTTTTVTAKPQVATPMDDIETEQQQEFPPSLNLDTFGRKEIKSSMQQVQANVNISHYDPNTGGVLGIAFVPYYFVEADKSDESFKMSIVAPNIESHNLVPNWIESTVQFYLQSNLLCRASKVKLSRGISQMSCS